MLIATEMNFCRRSAGISRRHRIRNDRIRDIMGISHAIVNDIKTKQSIWYSHVQIMSDDRLPKQILRWIPQEKKEEEYREEVGEGAYIEKDRTKKVARELMVR